MNYGTIDLMVVN